MKSGHIIMVALILTSIGMVSAASDDEIMLFSKGVLASDYERHTANILGDNLSIEGVSDEYGEKSVETVGSRLMRMSSLAKKDNRCLSWQIQAIGSHTLRLYREIRNWHDEHNRRTC